METSGEWNAQFPNLDEEIAKKIIQSEVEGGIKVENLPVGKTLKIVTQHHVYSLEHRTDGYYVSGHPEFCPDPERAVIAGSTFGGSMLKVGFVGRGMFLEFRLLGHDGIFTTSEISDMYIDNDDSATQSEESSI